MKIKQLYKKFFLLLLLVGIPLVLWQETYAMEDKDVINILVKNESLFVSNSLAGGVLRYIGWGITSALAAVGKAAANLYDTCFGFVDFTKYKAVTSFINEWKPVFISLVCLSLLLIGILLCVGWEKKPKIVINLMLAVTVVSASTFVLNTLNSFISTEVREGILGEEGASSVVYQTIGTNIHDLIYLDNTVGLENLNKKKNAKKTYKKFTEKQFDNMSINETIDPDDVSDEAYDIVNQGLLSEYDEKNNLVYQTEELYDGVAWTDLLNEYYYRYTVDWGVMWMELLSLIIIYLFMSYKVIRILYEIVVHRLLAYLYSANLNNNQKVLKIVDSLKDSYILLLFTTVMIKVYLLACDFISGWGISGLTKGFILLFLAFAVIDGPNLIQKLTGTDIGASDGMGKMMSMFYGGRMAMGAVGGAARAVRHGAGAAKSGLGKMAEKGKSVFSETASNGMDATEGMAEAAAGMAGVDTASNNENTSMSQKNQDNKQNLNQSNNQNNHADINENMSAGGEIRNSGEKTDGEQRGNDAMGEASSGNTNSALTAGQKESLSSETGKEAGGYRMDTIGQGMQSKKDALNGIQPGASHGLGGTDKENSLKNMERDIASQNSMNQGMSQHTDISRKSGMPTGAGGHLLREGKTENKEQAKRAREDFRG